jgi:hypothetical protein
VLVGIDGLVTDESSPSCAKTVFAVDDNDNITRQQEAANTTISYNKVGFICLDIDRLLFSFTTDNKTIIYGYKYNANFFKQNVLTQYLNYHRELLLLMMI